MNSSNNMTKMACCVLYAQLAPAGNARLRSPCSLCAVNEGFIHSHSCYTRLSCNASCSTTCTPLQCQLHATSYFALWLPEVNAHGVTITLGARGSRPLVLHAYVWADVAKRPQRRHRTQDRRSIRLHWSGLSQFSLYVYVKNPTGLDQARAMHEPDSIPSAGRLPWLSRSPRQHLR